MLFTFGWNLFSNGYFSSFLCCISFIHAAQIIVHYWACLKVKSVDWQLRVLCVGCGGLCHWNIKVTCCLSTVWEKPNVIYWNFPSGKLSQNAWQHSPEPFPSYLRDLWFFFFPATSWWGFPADPDAGTNMFLNSIQCRKCQCAFHWRHLSWQKLDELYYRVIFWTFFACKSTTVTFANASKSK